MDFSVQQVKTLKSVVKEVVGQVVEQEVVDRLRLTSELIRQDIQASEHRVMAYIDDKVDEVIQAVSNTIDTRIQPQLDTHDRRLTTLEPKMT